MPTITGDRPLLTDADVNAFSWQFQKSNYANDDYANWSLDRRLDGFFRHGGPAVSPTTATSATSSSTAS